MGVGVAVGLAVGLAVGVGVIVALGVVVMVGVVVTVLVAVRVGVGVGTIPKGRLVGILIVWWPALSTALTYQMCEPVDISIVGTKLV